MVYRTAKFRYILKNEKVLAAVIKIQLIANNLFCNYKKNLSFRVVVKHSPLTH